MKLEWPFRDKRWAGVTLEMNVKNLKDMEKLERSMKRFADATVQAADASERLADALERCGLTVEEGDG